MPRKPARKPVRKPRGKSRAAPRRKHPPKPSGKFRRRKHARPAEIAAAALDVFAERGFSAARVDDVAARAGVTKGTVYLYFASKEDLFKAVVRESLLPNIAQAEAMARDFEGPSAELIAALFANVGRIIATTKIGAIPKLVISEAGNFPDLARFYIREVIRRAFRLIGTILKRGMERGEFRALDVALTARAFACAFLFVAIWKHAMEAHDTERLDADAFLKNYLDLLLHGLAKG